MIKNIDHLSATKKRITIEVPAEVMSKEVNTLLDQYRKQANIPGYRQGKAPATLIDKRFGSSADSEAVERKLPSAWTEALFDAKLSPVSDPRLEGGLNFKRGEALTATFLVEVMPPIDNLSYEGVKVSTIEHQITEEDVDETLRRIMLERSRIEAMSEALKDGDVAVIDYEAADGSLKRSDEVFRVGSDYLPKSVSDAIIGKVKGDSAECEAEFPVDYPDIEIAGKKLTLRLTVRETKRIVSPEADDEFAKELGYDNIGGLRDRVRERLSESQKEGIVRLQRADLVRKLVESHEFEVPDVLLDRELENLMAQARTRSKQTDQEPPTEEALIEQLKPSALRNAKASVIIRAIGEREKITVSEDDMKSHITELSQRVNLPADNLLKYYVSRDGSFDGLRREVFEEKVIDLIHGKAVFEPVATSVATEEGK